jgi:small subunit ribosomal protein S1
MSEEIENTTGAEGTENQVAEAPVAEAPKPAPVKAAPTTDSKPDPDFDWSALGKKQQNYTADEVASFDKKYEDTLRSVIEHDVTMGKVVAKTSKELIVNIGYKSDGVISLSEVRYNPDIKVGDEIEVYVERQEDKSGQLVLSHKKARSLKSWERINQALENDEIIKGYIKSRTKGGLIAEIFGVEAFLPGSQIDVKPIRDYDVYVGKTMEFKVVKINNEFKNVVVSHKALIEAELEQQKVDIMSKLEKGQVLEGTVKNITSYGVFIDLGGVDGLIHITDLSWGRINHPEEIVKLDEKIQVVILDFDEGKKRIALGLKQLQAHPWDALSADLKVGDKVKGKVVVLADYGAFVEVAAGVEGLIHVSEMSWSQHLRSAQDFLKVGDEVEAVVLTLDRDERKMSLGMKQLLPNPWDEIEARYPVNSRHKGVVRNFTNFGIFVELEEGVDGLVHISDLSWSKKIKHPSEFTKVGEELEVVVLEIDKENRRLSLGHKQLEENPWEVFSTIFTEGSVHQGTVTSFVDKGAIVSLPYGVEGFAPMKHLVKEDKTTAKVEETLDFKVIEFSKENKKIVVSHTKLHDDAVAIAKSDNEDAGDAKASKDAKPKKVANKKVADNSEKSTLGDFDVLANLKSKMEKSEGATKAKAPKAVVEEAPEAPEAPAAEAPAAEETEAPTEE